MITLAAMAAFAALCAHDALKRPARVRTPRSFALPSQRRADVSKDTPTLAAETATGPAAGTSGRPLAHPSKDAHRAAA